MTQHDPKAGGGHPGYIGVSAVFSASHRDLIRLEGEDG